MTLALADNQEQRGIYITTFSAYPIGPMVLIKVPLLPDNIAQKFPDVYLLQEISTYIWIWHNLVFRLEVGRSIYCTELMTIWANG